MASVLSSELLSEPLLDPLNAANIRYSDQDELLRAVTDAIKPDESAPRSFDTALEVALPRALAKIPLLRSLQGVSKAPDLQGVRITGIKIDRAESTAFDAIRSTDTYTTQTYLLVENTDGKKETVKFARMPLMRGSKYESTYNNNNVESWLLSVCPYDMRGYFVVKGKRQVLMTLRRANHDRVIVSYSRPKNKNEIPEPEAQLTARDELRTKKIRIAIRKSVAVLAFTRATSALEFWVNAIVVYDTFDRWRDRDQIISDIASFVPNTTERMDITNRLRYSFNAFDAGEMSDNYRKLAGAGANAETRGRDEFRRDLRDLLFLHVANLRGDPPLNEEEQLRRSLRMFDYLLATAMQFGRKRIEPNDLDNYADAQILNQGTLFSNLFASYVRMAVTDDKFDEAIISNPTWKRFIDTLAGKAGFVSDHLRQACGGKWSTSYYKHASIVHAPDHSIPTQTLSVTRQIRIPAQSKGKQEQVRALNPTARGFIGDDDTPEGQPCGLVIHYGATAQVTDWATTDTINTLYRILLQMVTTYESEKNVPRTGSALCMFNGVFLGWIDAESAMTDLRARKIAGTIDRTTTIALRPRVPVNARSYRDPRLAGPLYPELIVSVEASRFIRPLIRVIEGDFDVYVPPTFTGNRFLYLLERGKIEWVSPVELESVRVSESRQTLQSLRTAVNEGQKHVVSLQEKILHARLGEATDALVAKLKQVSADLVRRRNLLRDTSYVEISESALSSNLSALIPWGGDRTPGARRMVANNCARAAIPVLPSVYDPGQRLVLPDATPPLIVTALDEPSRRLSLPWGGAALIAAIINDPNNNEDAYVINSTLADLDRYAVQHRTSFTLGSATRGGITSDRKPKRKEDNPLYSIDPYRFRHLDDNGIVRIGSEVHERDVLISAVRIRATQTLGGNAQRVAGREEEGREQVSNVYYNMRTPGIVTEVIMEGGGTINSITGVRIVVTAIEPPGAGDKFSSREGQKGVAAPIKPAHLMPYAILTRTDGTTQRLDIQILANPIATLGRQTFGRPLEMAFGMVAAATGRRISARTFGQTDVSQAYDLMRAAGFEYYGNLPVFNPATGNTLIAKILVGPLTFSSLHQRASTQMSQRTGSEVNSQTGETKRGQGGGYRVGEMEVDQLNGVRVDVSQLARAHAGSSTIFVCELCRHKVDVATRPCPLCKVSTSIVALDVRSTTVQLLSIVQSGNTMPLFSVRRRPQQYSVDYRGNL